MLIEKGVLYIVATPIGNLGDISARAGAVLGAVSEVWAEDTRHSRRLFQHLGISPQVLACHDHNESERVGKLMEKLHAGDSIALICDAGTPLISDPGYRLVSACRQQGFQVQPVPGASALIAALSISGLATDRFAFEGFLPSKGSARSDRLRHLRDEKRTLIFYESSHRILASLLAMREHFGADRTAVVARELTKLHETVIADTLDQLCKRVADDSNQQKGEFVVLVTGAKNDAVDTSAELNRVLKLLLPEMSVRRAAAIAAKITGTARNRAYRAALNLSG